MALKKVDVSSSLNKKRKIKSKKFQARIVERKRRKLSMWPQEAQAMFSNGPVDFFYGRTSVEK